MIDMIEPGATIGILGGGQLGHMLGLAAARLGYKIAIYCPHLVSPAFNNATVRFHASYDDEAALTEFARSCDVISFEFENVPARSLELLCEHTEVRPGINSLSTTQDRLYEKDFLSVLDIPVAPYRAVGTALELAETQETLGPDIIAKTRRLGYDGKGQVRLASPDIAEAAWEKLNSGQVIAEQRIAFDREISVLLARSLDGDIATWPISENLHEGGILRSTQTPARISDMVAELANGYAQAIAETLDYVGVMAVEMFVIDKTNEVIVNEIAPRVHNSGHWTMEGAITDQFEQHVRAICGLPLGATDALGKVRMDNLIGNDIARWPTLLSDPQACLHHYGKGAPRPGRKMGHVTWVTPFSKAEES